MCPTPFRVRRLRLIRRRRLQKSRVMVMGLNLRLAWWGARPPPAALLHASVDQLITPLATQPEPQPKLLGAGASRESLNSNRAFGLCRGKRQRRPAR